MTALELKEKLIETRRRFFLGEATEADFNLAADAYIQSIRDFKKSRGDKKLRIPTRTQLLRWSF